MYTIYRQFYATPSSSTSSRIRSPPKHNPSPLVDCWGPTSSGRYRSDCSTVELTSDVEFPVLSREGSGTGGRPADGSCTAPSCSVKFEEFGDGARTKRQIQQAGGTRSLHASFAHLSIPNAEGVAVPEAIEIHLMEAEERKEGTEEERQKEPYESVSPTDREKKLYSKRDMMRTFCFMVCIWLLLLPLLLILLSLMPPSPLLLLVYVQYSLWCVYLVVSLSVLHAASAGTAHPPRGFCAILEGPRASRAHRASPPCSRNDATGGI